MKTKQVRRSESKSAAEQSQSKVRTVAAAELSTKTRPVECAEALQVSGRLLQALYSLSLTHDAVAMLFRFWTDRVENNEEGKVEFSLNEHEQNGLFQLQRIIGETLRKDQAAAWDEMMKLRELTGAEALLEERLAGAGIGSRAGGTNGECAISQATEKVRHELSAKGGAR